MAQISFSIVVVCLNPGEKLLKTVQSVLNQKYGNYEIVVKDGGSTDGSLEQLPADSRIRVYTRPDSGIYDAMNQAMSYVTGQFVQFLNCGDLLHDDMVLEYGANRESIQAAMHELRGYTKLVKNAAEAQAGKITEVYGEAKAFDVCLAKAQQNIEARITAPENAKPPVVELQFANEGEPLLQAVGAEHLVDFGRMTANAIKQHEQEGSFEDENL